MNVVDWKVRKFLVISYSLVFHHRFGGTGLVAFFMCTCVVVLLIVIVICKCSSSCTDRW